MSDWPDTNVTTPVYRRKTTMSNKNRILVLLFIILVKNVYINIQIQQIVPIQIILNF